MNSITEAVTSSWEVDPWIPALMFLTCLVYARGWWKLHQRRPDGFGFRHLLCFLAGQIVLFVAIVSPLHELAELSLMAHMIQHVLLMMVVPPLILLGAPHLPLLSGLSWGAMQYVLRPFLVWTPLKRLGHFLIHPLNCWLAFVGSTLAWHTPVMFELALRSELWHTVEHICFLTTGLLFWWPVIQPWPSRARWPRWAMFPYLLLADFQNSALSAFLLFFDRVVYPTYATTPRLFGMSALEDQAAAGAIMWVPGSCAFLIPLVLISVSLMSSSRGTARRSDASPAPTAQLRTQSRLIRIGIVCAFISFPFTVWGQTTDSQRTQAKPAASAPMDYGMPEHLARKVAPTPNAPWSPPDLSGYTKMLKSGEASPIDPQKRYSLVELIDVAERANPETRVAWESARQAAIAVGLVESEYFPVLTLSALGGYQSEAFPAPKDVAPNGFFRANLEQVVPTLNLRWLLLDFGRRGSAMDAAKERLLAANLGFNRKHQEIIFRVSRAFLALTSLRGKIAVAQSAVDSSRAVRESADAQLGNGLSTLPEVSLARQQEAQAAFELEDVLASERDAQVALAESVGIPPTTPIQVTEFSALPAPGALEDSADKVIDQALENRPDLIAKVATLRMKEAQVSRARAEYFPTLSLVSNVNTIAGRAKVTGGNQSTGWFSAAEPSYGVGLALHWNLFEGGATQRRVELAEAERRSAEAEVTATRDKAIRDVWKAYTDVRLAVRRLDVAAALLDASQRSYESLLESYRHGLETLTNLLAARRELSRARFVDLDTRVQLLNASAALAFATGTPAQGH
jgi:outer membrane protein